MVPEQKRAWFAVATCGAAVVGILAALPFLGIAAFAFAGLVGFSGLAPLLFRKRREPGQVDEDERDRMIARLANRTSWRSSYLAYVLACMITWFVQMFRGQEIITVHALPWMVFFGLFVLIFVRSVVVLIAYGSELRHGED